MNVRSPRQGRRLAAEEGGPKPDFVPNINRRQESGTRKAPSYDRFGGDSFPFTALHCKDRGIGSFPHFSDPVTAIPESPTLRTLPCMNSLPSFARGWCMFGWFKKRPRPPQPESKWLVEVDGARISVRSDAGEVKSVEKGNLCGVAIETNDSGPWGADVWWLLFAKDNQLACAFPQGATGEETVIAYLSALPSFDHGEMIRAMGSTDNAVFVVWRRPI